MYKIVRAIDSLLQRAVFMSEALHQCDRQQMAKFDRQALDFTSCVECVEVLVHSLLFVSLSSDGVC